MIFPKLNGKPRKMACYTCNQYGHWSSKCPQAACKFCGQKGHTAFSCPIQKECKPKIKTDTLEDIMFSNHIVPTCDMKQNVDAFVKKHFSYQGMVDYDKLADYVFGPEGMYTYSVDDDGHIAVLGYMINKYCEVSNYNVKNFLRSLRNKFPEDAEQFRIFLKTKLGVIPTGNHFRKYTGYLC